MNRRTNIDDDAMLRLTFSEAIFGFGKLFNQYYDAFVCAVLCVIKTTKQKKGF